MCVSWFWMRRFTALPAGKSPVALYLDRTFVSPDDILERIPEVLLGPCQSLRFVRFSDELAIGAAVKCPSQ